LSQLLERRSPSSGRDSQTEIDVRLPTPVDQAGTPPEDRAFRPDIEGLRAIAVLVVVLAHARVPHLAGGFIGVDVFFVISGFVITGLLLRESAATARIRVLPFYGRRARRIVPSAMLVIVATVLAERLIVGHTAANLVASDAKWAAVFLANFTPGHGNLFSPTPAPLSAYWSLAVEEQFYLVYPVLFLLVLTIGRHWSLRLKLSALLAVAIATSFAWSVISSPGSLTAYASPLTRAWELAIGGLLAAGAGWLNRMPGYLAAIMSWAGLVGIALAASVVSFTIGGYPGYIAALPVGATCLIIAGGTAAPRLGAEVLLKQAPFKWLGRWSYAIYLWHYPILIIATQHWGHTNVPTNLMLAGAAVALAAGTYFAIENPIRHWSFLTRFPLASVLGGTGLIVTGMFIVTFAI
jgi:peptidoglycan/LPS O-acetylase OafA/YrhL